MILVALLIIYTLMVVIFSLIISEGEKVLKQKAPKETKAVILLWPVFAIWYLFYFIFLQSYLSIVKTYKWYRSSSDE